MPTEEELADLRRRSAIAVANAKAVLKAGDRLRVTKCPGTKRWITFASWDGSWIVSKSGIDDFSAACVDRLNGDPVDFSSGQDFPDTEIDLMPVDSRPKTVDDW